MTDDNVKQLPGTVAESPPAAWEAFPTSSHASALDAKRFRLNLDKRSVNRDTMMEWLRDALTVNVDFGRIHIAKNCQDKYNCTNPYHFSKPSLWKPGAEKICGMLGLTVTFPGLGAYEAKILEGVELKQVMLRCHLLNDQGQIVGEGVGCRSVIEDARTRDDRLIPDLNKTIKMAEKSAMIDAVLRAGGLSEVFTQDMEDQFTDESADPYAPGADGSHNPFEGSANINLETHCTIGKWKGREWKEVDEGYLRWLIDNIDDKPELIARAKRELTDRQTATEVEHGERPKEAGNKTLADAARQLSMAKTATELEDVWNSIDEQQRVPLKGTYVLRKKEIDANG